MAESFNFFKMGNLKVYIIVGLIIIAILLAVFFIGKYKGKQYAPDTVKLPSDTQGTSVPSNWNPGTITDALHYDLYCKACFRNTQPYIDASALSNSQVVAVHNDWNQRYFSENKETLRQAMDAEFTAFNSAADTAMGILKEKLKSLGL